MAAMPMIWLIVITCPPFFQSVPMSSGKARPPLETCQAGYGDGGLLVVPTLANRLPPGSTKAAPPDRCRGRENLVTDLVTDLVTVRSRIWSRLPIYRNRTQSPCQGVKR